MRKLKILIVDFDEEASRYLSEFLKAEGFDVSNAADGEVGLEKCKSEMPDLVVVEPMISKLHGFELCSIITNDFNGKIPVVILTKFYREEQFKIEAMRSYGAAAFLSKPFKGPDILETLKNLLKDKIKEDEEEEMAEDIQGLDEISDNDLEKLEIDVPLSISKKPAKEFEEEMRESLASSQRKAEPQTEKAQVSKIDKMLEDTLSEFGLNIEKKEKPRAEDKMEFRAKMDALVEELKNGKSTDESETLEPKIKIPATKESEVKEDEVDELEVREPEGIENDVKAPVEVAPKLEEPQGEPIKIPDASKRLKENPVEKVKKETTIFAAEIEQKEKGSFFQNLKNSLPFIKKHPLKFLIPGVLIAAIAVSASFVFRKPKNSTPSPKQTVAAMQQAKSQEMTAPEEFVIESPGQAVESKLTQEAGGEAKEPDKEAEAPVQDAQEATVKTRVSEVFQVKVPDSNSKPDINPIDISEDVLSAEPGEEIAAPILSETEPPQIPGENRELGTLPSSDIAAQNLTQKDSDSPSQEEIDTPSAYEKPKTKIGDLVPMSEIDIPPEVAKRVEPNYPSYALSRGVGGKVILNVLISENGNVIETALLKGIKGPYGFNEECEKAVRQWKFVPAFKNGIKVKVWKTVSFTFKQT